MAIAPTSICAVSPPVPTPNPGNAVMPPPTGLGPSGDTGVPKADPAGVAITPPPNPYGSVGERLEIGGVPVASPAPNGERLAGDIGVCRKPNAGNGIEGQICGTDPKNDSAMCNSFDFGRS